MLSHRVAPSLTAAKGKRRSISESQAKPSMVRRIRVLGFGFAFFLQDSEALSNCRYPTRARRGDAGVESWLPNAPAGSRMEQGQWVARVRATQGIEASRRDAYTPRNPMLSSRYVHGTGSALKFRRPCCTSLPRAA